jgi:hypothetical protein
LNTAFISSLYAAMHASTSISSRPSMMAMSLSHQLGLAVMQSSTYPPVLVPPMRSNTSHGFTWGRPAFWRWWFRRVMRPLRMYRVLDSRCTTTTLINVIFHVMIRLELDKICLV